MTGAVTSVWTVEDDKVRVLLVQFVSVLRGEWSTTAEGDGLVF